MRAVSRHEAGARDDAPGWLVRSGIPRRILRFIHLCRHERQGFHGKPSAESCLHAAGYRVESCIRRPIWSACVNASRSTGNLFPKPILPEAWMPVCRALQEINQSATYFEVMTALALRHFAREKVDWVWCGKRDWAAASTRRALCVPKSALSPISGWNISTSTWARRCEGNRFRESGYHQIRACQWSARWRKHEAPRRHSGAGARKE